MERKSIRSICGEAAGLSVLLFLAALVIVALVTLPSCTKEEAKRFNRIENKVKTGFKIANESLGVVDSLVHVAAPTSTAAKNLDSATVIANKVDDKVQSVTIVIPVDDDPAAAPAPSK